MQVFVINLARATDRMALMARQLELLGLDFTRLEAVTPETLEPDANDAHWQRWQRPMRSTEMALTASHRAVWRQVRDGPALVLEDDALLSFGIADWLSAVADRPGIEHLSLETRGRKKLLTRGPGELWAMHQDRTGSAAYVIWPAGARALLEREAAVAAPSDALISETPMASFQAVPARAVQFDMCAAYGIPAPVETRSLIDAVEKPPVPRGAGFRRRRILGQLAMGLTAVSHPSASRLHVQPAMDLADTARALRDQ